MPAPHRLLRAAVVATLVTVAATVTTLASVAPATAAPAYLNGPISYSHIFNCLSVIQGVPYIEYGAGTSVGYLADPVSGQPAVNGTYYLQVVVSALGNACSGQYADIQFKLPAATTTAVTAGTPIRCFYDDITVTDCPQNLVPGNQDGLLRISSSRSDGLWPLPIGRIVTIRVPVRSTAPLSGAPFTGFVTLYDGNSTPTFTPNVGVTVFGAGNPGQAQPQVTYPNPSTTGITATTAVSNVNLQSDGVAGNLWFELSKVPDMSALAFSEPPLAVPAGYVGSANSDWTPYPLESGTRYYWRARFTPSDGSPSVQGSIQTFTTSAGPIRTVGTGTPGSCTSAELAGAASSASSTIKFNCGSAAVTIALASTLSLANKTVDGGDLVTLQAPAGGRHFTITGTTTLKNLTLTGANHHLCGGAINVAAGTTTFMSGRIIGNRTTQAGGGVCVAAGAYFEVFDSIVSQNTAGSTGGGIHSLGDLTFWRSELAGNVASSNGGGLHASGPVDIRQAALTDNRAGGAAGQSALDGGVYSTGSLSFLTATLSGNRAGDGAALATVNGAGPASAWLGSLTIANNTAHSSSGSAVRINGTGAGWIRNTLVADNAPRNCAAQYTTQGSNHDSGTTCGFTRADDRRNVSARLALLTMNEGTIATRTHALLPGSSAIDAGNNTYCGMADQRGVGRISTHGEPSRDIDGDGNGTSICDVGAFEVKPDGTAPTATAITRLGASPTNSSSVQWRVDFSEPVTLVDGADFALVSTGVTGASITAVSPAASTVATTWTVTATTGSGVAGTLRLDVRSAATIRDASNVALTTGRQGSTYQIDRSAPPTTTPPVTSPPVTPPPVTTPPVTPPGGGSGTGSGLVPVVPARVLDSRVADATVDGLFSGMGVLAAGSVTEVQVAGRAGVPVGAVAASFNVTVAGAVGDGYATIYPCDAPRPNASNLNFVAGDVVPNAVIAKLSASGTVCIYTFAATHLLVDVNAAFI